MEERKANLKVYLFSTIFMFLEPPEVLSSVRPDSRGHGK